MRQRCQISQNINRFWRLIEHVIGEPLPSTDYEVRLQALLDQVQKANAPPADDVQRSITWTLLSFPKNSVACFPIADTGKDRNSSRWVPTIGFGA